MLRYAEVRGDVSTMEEGTRRETDKDAWQKGGIKVSLKFHRPKEGDVCAGESVGMLRWGGGDRRQEGTEKPPSTPGYSVICPCP